MARRLTHANPETTLHARPGANPQADVLYLFSEYYADADAATHAAAIRSRGDWMLGLIDPWSQPQPGQGERHDRIGKKRVGA